MVNAIAVLTGPNGGNGTVPFSQKGIVRFQADDSSTTTVEGNISGVTPGDHALIIHTYGNVTNGWESTGPPFILVGNITVDGDGNADFKFSGKIPLSPPDSVIGRVLVLHSYPSPNPGDGVAWGIIGLDA